MIPTAIPKHSHPVEPSEGDGSCTVLEDGYKTSAPTAGSHWGWKNAGHSPAPVLGIPTPQQHTGTQNCWLKLILQGDSTGDPRRDPSSPRPPTAAAGAREELGWAGLDTSKDSPSLQGLLAGISCEGCRSADVTTPRDFCSMSSLDPHMCQPRGCPLVGNPFAKAPRAALPDWDSNTLPRMAHCSSGAPCSWHWL